MPEPLICYFNDFCLFFFPPVPEHNWFKGNKIIKPSRYFQMSLNSGGVYTLKISEAFPEDEGEYKCEVKTPAGSVSTSAKLRVQGVYSSRFLSRC